MNYGKKIHSPIGMLYLIAEAEALISIDHTCTELFKNSTVSVNHKILEMTHKQLDEYFNRERMSFSIPLNLKGTLFQQKTWETLSRIPFGKVWSYGEQAHFMKMPKAARAVGGANGKNPIPIIIPCHRVVGSTGKLTGFSGGMQMKIDLLRHEGHQLLGLQLIKN